jgi:hypothetical protein
MPGSVAPPLVVEQVAEIDPPVSADHVERNFASFHEPDQKWPRNAENICGSLRGELPMLGHDRNRVSRLQVPQDHEKKIVERLGDGYLAAIRSDQLGVSRLNQSAEIADLLLLGCWNRDWIGKRGRHGSPRLQYSIIEIFETLEINEARA